MLSDADYTEIIICVMSNLDWHCDLEWVNGLSDLGTTTSQ